MAQLSLYMDSISMEGLRVDAAERGISISAYARDVLANRHTAERNGWRNGWPPGYFDLFGSSPAFPDVSDAAAEPIAAW